MNEGKTKIETLCPHCFSVNRLDGSKVLADPRCGRCHQPLFDGLPVSLDDARFTRMISREQLPVVVDFWATWCGPCKSMAPVFSAAAKELKTGARFAKLDVDAAPGASTLHEVRSIPTLIIFKQTQPVARSSGAMSLHELKAWVGSHL